MNLSNPGLYIHIPFCHRVCPYCDFAVLKEDAARHRPFVDALCKEVEMWSGAFEQIDTIYFGGGTPSRLSLAHLERVIKTVKDSFTIAEDIRVFFEANPEDVTSESAAGWRDLGIGTLSLGVQSLSNAGLAYLGREHSADEARQAFDFAREVGFETVSLDLIYGFPKHTVQDWEQEIEEVLSWEPDHVSCYQLTIEPRTKFGALAAKGKLIPLDIHDQAIFFRHTHQKFKQAGFEGYEVSQFTSASEHKSRHNMKYWNHVPYLGVGPSAHSFRGTERWWNHPKEGMWRAAINQNVKPIAGKESLTEEDLALEALMVGLRTSAGVDLVKFEAQFEIGLLELNEKTINAFESAGLIELTDQRIIPTLEGFAVADALASKFILS